jgi:hypothetical protein
MFLLGFRKTASRESVVEWIGWDTPATASSPFQNQSFTEFNLRFARNVTQRHEHLSGAELLLAYVILHDRVAARVPLLFS